MKWLYARARAAFDSLTTWHLVVMVLASEALCFYSGTLIHASAARELRAAVVEIHDANSRIDDLNARLALALGVSPPELCPAPPPPAAT